LLSVVHRFFGPVSRFKQFPSPYHRRRPQTALTTRVRDRNAVRRDYGYNTITLVFTDGEGRRIRPVIPLRITKHTCILFTRRRNSFSFFGNISADDRASRKLANVVRLKRTNRVVSRRVYSNDYLYFNIINAGAMKV
jgi:hypothetical protein